MFVGIIFFSQYYVHMLLWTANFYVCVVKLWRQGSSPTCPCSEPLDRAPPAPSPG